MDALTREQELEGGRDPNGLSFFDSHPTTPDRARDAREYAAKLEVASADRIAIDRTAFVQRLDGLALGESVRAGLFLDGRFLHPELGFGISFPDDWEHENSPSAVVAQPEDGSAVLAVQLAGKGDDPTAFADQFETKVPFLERSAVEKINQLPAVIGIAQVVDDGEEINLFLTWIAKDGLVYRVLGAAPTSRWNEHHPNFEAAARSFHALSDRELRELHVNRLRLVKAHAGETLTAIAARSSSQWSAEKMAVANDLSTSAPLPDGETIKISKREPY
ncbi:MAG TPA: hypothetical protein VFG22_03295 [Polyangiales bacterium]|nr:hypothetical protein [Polyangiales bacterium]